MNQKEQNKNQIAGLQQHKLQLEQLLACQICYVRASHPTLCPHCSKIYCQNCIAKSLKFKSQCPNCRQTIKGQLTNCSRFLNQLSIIIGSFIEYEQQNQKCTKHNINLNYFCENCNKSACCQCKMFGQHQTHIFKPISLIYQEKYGRIRELLSTLKAKILEKEEEFKEIEDNLVGVKTKTEAQIFEINQFTQKYKHKIAMESASQNHNEFQVAQALRMQMKELEQLKEVVIAKAEQASKSHCYRPDLDLISRIQRTLLKSKEMLAVNKNVTSIQEVTPSYRKYSFVIRNYSSKKMENKGICSDTIEYQGSLWRLVVYPEGNANNSNYLSIFVELIKNPDSINQYEYLVELVHPSDSKKNIVKEHQTMFQINECWGYGKFIKNEELELVNFINKESDTLEILFGVKMCYYYDLYKRRENLLRLLENEISVHDEKIELLQSQIYRGSNTSIQLK